MAADANREWCKSSYSGSNGGQCVEVRLERDRVGVRDSKNRGPELWFTGEQWDRFLSSDIRGEWNAGIALSRLRESERISNLVADGIY
ncbi:DUF397 domain-containing protein [Nocardia sp. SYP-A9097]|uniref:DUF397 domain-containing protein n=1 Tax=Nocardia sp. SYP-A9097 TaxID=2663237 RepID=UPI00129A1314|nr:DUF397 domain-containing protein [Nocardia sp. SYP-A9097]MRH88633.1 DUF397 domain-containing protein [Nocardia sp. SYP-A9097]